MHVYEIKGGGHETELQFEDSTAPIRHGAKDNQGSRQQKDHHVLSSTHDRAPCGRCNTTYMCTISTCHFGISLLSTLGMRSS